MKYKRFEDLPVWQDAIELSVRIFELTGVSCVSCNSWIVFCLAEKRSTNHTKYTKGAVAVSFEARSKSGALHDSSEI